MDILGFIAGVFCVRMVNVSVRTKHLAENCIFVQQKHLSNAPVHPDKVSN